MSELTRHIHQESHLKSSAFLQDVVIGISDGLTVPFALAAGLSGAVSTNALIITAGLAEIAAGSIAMGLGGYLSGRTAIEHYSNELKREYEEIERVPEMEKQEIKDVFARYGLSNKTLDELVGQISANPTTWVNFMMKFELGLDKPDRNRARNSALTIGFSYVIGGFVPLLPYMLNNTPRIGLSWSAFFTVICLFVFGYYKSKLTGENPFQGAAKVTLIGTIAAAAAFYIAKLIS